MQNQDFFPTYFRGKRVREFGIVCWVHPSMPAKRRLGMGGLWVLWVFHVGGCCGLGVVGAGVGIGANGGWGRRSEFGDRRLEFGGRSSVAGVEVDGLGSST